MRVFMSHRTWIKAGIVCLPCLLSSGCKSTGPGMGWLSWAKPKPLSTALSSNVPTKPSVNSLPPPSTTTGALGTGAGPNTNLASFPGSQGSGLNTPAAPAGNGYYTGPYGMSGAGQPGAGQSSVASAQSPNGGYGSNAYGGVPAANQSQPPAYGGYQSPYQSAAPAAPAGNAYRTADARNAPAGAAPNAYGGATGGATASGAHAWNNEQWGRSEPRGVSQPAGYTEGIPQRGPETPQPNAGAAVDPSQQAPATAISPGGYRPGSTGRTTNTLPTAAPASSLPASGYRAPGGAYPAANYPASYPTSSYPAADPTATRTANSTGYAGGYAYPSTPQAR